MKTRYTIMLIILGIALEILGALVKILHLPGADLILSIGGIIEILGWLLFLVKVVRNPKLKEVLDW
jgi:hypothetical protein